MDDRTNPKDRYRPLSEAELSAAIPVNENFDTPRDDAALISPVPAEAPDLPAAHHSSASSAAPCRH
jgi:hypothetical protein